MEKNTEPVSPNEMLKSHHFVKTGTATKMVPSMSNRETGGLPLWEVVKWYIGAYFSDSESCYK